MMLGRRIDFPDRIPQELDLSLCLVDLVVLFPQEKVFCVIM
jgi:hypothetical protein